MRLAGVAEVRFTGRADGDLGKTTAGGAGVTERRANVLLACGIAGITAGRQVHGADVAIVERAADGYRVAEQDADGQATALPGLGVAVHVADCLPIAVAGDGGVAMLHGGWRGLAAGVVDRGVAALRQLGVVGRLEAAIGPGAGGCCYEAGKDVHDLFAGLGGSSGRQLNLKAVARSQLERAGVVEVHDVGVCTICAAPGLVYSHRRDGPATGRQAGIAWLD